MDHSCTRLELIHDKPFHSMLLDGYDNMLYDVTSQKHPHLVPSMDTVKETDIVNT